MVRMANAAATMNWASTTPGIWNTNQSLRISRFDSPSICGSWNSISKLKPTTSGGSTTGGPWPDPDDDIDLRAEAERLGQQAGVIAEQLDDAGDRVTDHLDDIDDHVADWDRRTDAAGSKGVAFAVAGINLGALLVLPVLLVVGIYTFITIYAIVKAVSGGSDEPDALTIMLGVVGLVTLLVTLLGVGGWLIGRTADPKKRR